MPPLPRKAAANTPFGSVLAELRHPPGEAGTREEAPPPPDRTKIPLQPSRACEHSRAHTPAPADPSHSGPTCFYQAPSPRAARKKTCPGFAGSFSGYHPCARAPPPPGDNPARPLAKGRPPFYILSSGPTIYPLSFYKRDLSESSRKISLFPQASRKLCQETFLLCQRNRKKGHGLFE